MVLLSTPKDFRASNGKSPRGVRVRPIFWWNPGSCSTLIMWPMKTSKSLHHSWSCSALESQGVTNFPCFWGNQTWCKSMVILRDYLITMHCLGCWYDDPCIFKPFGFRFFVWCRSCCGCFNFGGGNGWWKSQERTDSIIQSRFFSLWKSLADCVSVILKCQDFARHIRLSDCEKVLRRTSSPCHWKPPPKGCVSPVGSPARTSPVGNWSQTILQEVHLVSRAYPPWN